MELQFNSTSTSNYTVSGDYLTGDYLPDKKKEEDVVDKAVEEPTAAIESDNDEAIAAICMALYQHLNAHDEESGVLTFDHSHEAHSAWGSKGNLLLRTPEHHNNH